MRRNRETDTKGGNAHQKPPHSYNSAAVTFQRYSPLSTHSCLNHFNRVRLALLFFQSGQDSSYPLLRSATLPLAKPTVPLWHPRAHGRNTAAIEPRGAPPGSADYAGTGRCLCWHSRIKAAFSPVCSITPSSSLWLGKTQSPNNGGPPFSREMCQYVRLLWTRWGFFFFSWRLTQASWVFLSDSAPHGSKRTKRISF